MSFSNSYKHTIDSKKRLFIPAKFRAKLGDSFYLYYDESLPCIAVYGEEEWEKKSKIVEESGDADWQRFFFSNVISVEPDKQGRITVKASFCEGAGLKRTLRLSASVQELKFGTLKSTTRKWNRSMLRTRDSRAL